MDEIVGRDTELETIERWLRETGRQITEHRVQC